MIKKTILIFALAIGSYSAFAQRPICQSIQHEVDEAIRDNRMEDSLTLMAIYEYLSC